MFETRRQCPGVTAAGGQCLSSLSVVFPVSRIG